MSGAVPMRARLAALWREWRGTLLLVALILALRSVVIDWYYVPSGSMQPSILIGDRILVQRAAFDLRVPFTTWSLRRLGEPQRGDIIVFWSPDDGERLVKRLVGVPGDTLELRGQTLLVDGVPTAYRPIGELRDAIRLGERSFTAQLFEEQLAGHPHPVALVLPQGHEFGPRRLGADEYWMMGDNRDNSRDSRYFGPVPRRLLAGRATRVIWSIDEGWHPRWARFGEPLP
jgi:signal peptidase I